MLLDLEIGEFNDFYRFESYELTEFFNKQKQLRNGRSDLVPAIFRELDPFGKYLSHEGIKVHLCEGEEHYVAIEYNNKKLFFTERAYNKLNREVLEFVEFKLFTTSN